MREVTIKQDDKTTITIKSPWLDIASCCRYLAISRNEFLKVFADNIPFKGFGNRRRYHAQDLDNYNPHADREAQ